MEQVPSFLQGVYMDRLQRNRRYSLRAYARDLQLNHGHLSRILNGKRPLSLRQGIAISERLGLSNEGRQRLLKNITEQAIAPTRKAATSDYFIVQVDQFKCFSEWYHVAILELTSLVDFRSEPQWIAKKLGISIKEARAAVARLQRLKLLQKGMNWKRMHQFVSIPTLFSSEAIQTFHRQMLEKALKEIEKKNQKDFIKREVGGGTLAIDPLYIPAIKKQIIAFRKSLMKKYCTKGSPSELYQLNTQFFPLTRSSQ